MLADGYKLMWEDDEKSNGTKGPGPDGESVNACAERIMGVVKVGVFVVCVCVVSVCVFLTVKRASRA